MYLVKNFRLNQILLYGVFTVIFIFGMNIAKDFGLSWDSMQRSSGIKTAGFIMTKFGISNPLEKNYQDYPDNHNDAYGVIFDLVSIGLEKLFNLNDKKDIYIMRHKLNFSFYFIGCLFYFFISKKVFGFKIAIISTLIYALHPRLLAHGFFNPKDSILQSFLVITTYPILLSFEKKSIKWFILSGIMMGICISTRMVMAYIPFLFIFFTIILNINSNTFNVKYELKEILKKLSFTIVFCIISLIFFLPILWENTITNLIWAFQTMKNFPWNGSVLFMGDKVSSNNLPWYYLIVWYFISTPLSFCFLYVLGIIRCIYFISFDFIKENPLLYFSISGILIPYFAVIFLNSTLYDGWRHFYFVYPFISIICIYGILLLKDIMINYFSIKSKKIFYTLVFLIFYSPIVAIFKMHPHQNVYFNILAGKDPLLNFEGDYWGISYKQGIENLIKYEENDILLAVGNFPGKNNLQMIDKNDRKRIKIVDKRYAKYFMTNFRSEKNDYLLSKKGLYPYDKEIHKINFGDMKILGLYELP